MAITGCNLYNFRIAFGMLSIALSDGTCDAKISVDYRSFRESDDVVPLMEIRLFLRLLHSPDCKFLRNIHPLPVAAKYCATLKGLAVWPLS
jgi:hypothetical protein